MSTHTPGPWVVLDRDHVGDNIFTASHPRRRIASTYGTSLEHEDEFLANARLISAAPELLDLANKVVGFCVALRGEDCWDNHYDAGLLYSLAKAAIAKATEESE